MMMKLLIIFCVLQSIGATSYPTFNVGRDVSAVPRSLVINSKEKILYVGTGDPLSLISYRLPTLIQLWRTSISLPVSLQLCPSSWTTHTVYDAKSNFVAIAIICPSTTSSWNYDSLYSFILTFEASNGSLISRNILLSSQTLSGMISTPEMGILFSAREPTKGTTVYTLTKSGNITQLFQRSDLQAYSLIQVDDGSGDLILGGSKEFSLDCLVTRLSLNGSQTVWSKDPFFPIDFNFCYFIPHATDARNQIAFAHAQYRGNNGGLFPNSGKKFKFVFTAFNCSNGDVLWIYSDPDWLNVGYDDFINIMQIDRVNRTVFAIGGSFAYQISFFSFGYDRSSLYTRFISGTVSAGWAEGLSLAISNELGVGVVSYQKSATSDTIELFNVSSYALAEAPSPSSSSRPIPTMYASSESETLQGTEETSSKLQLIHFLKASISLVSTESASLRLAMTDQTRSLNVWSTTNIIIICVVCTAFVLVALILVKWKKRSKAKEENDIGSTEMVSRTKTETHVQTTMSIASSVNTTFSTTMVKGFSVPAYLEFQKGIDFELGSIIAIGGFGKIFRATVKSERLRLVTKTNVIAVKEYLHGIEDVTVDEGEEEVFNQEVGIIAALQSEKNIVQFFGYSTRPASLLMRHYSSMSLEKWISNEKQKLKSKKVKTMFALDIARGLQALHNFGVAHCDLKPANVLIDVNSKQERHCVLTDFGCARIVDESHVIVHAFKRIKQEGFSTKYTAPEFLIKKEIQDLRMIDLYSFGVILFELLKLESAW